MSSKSWNVSGMKAHTDHWAYCNRVKLAFSRLGKPVDNATMESFNGRFRQERLNIHWFETVDDAEAKKDRCLEMRLQRDSSSPGSQGAFTPGICEENAARECRRLA
jgi:transposase InsO family protein